MSLLLFHLASWIPRSVFGAIVAVLYVAFAIYAVKIDRGAKEGDWISLKGMMSFLTTFPVSLACEQWGAKLNFRRNLDMAFAISLCGMLVYLLGAGVGKLARLIFPA